MRVKDTFTKPCKERVKKLQEQARESALDLAIDVIEDAKTIVPVDSGRLRDSGFVEQNMDGRTKFGFSERYAIFVHEIAKNYRNGRRWKYLREAISRRGGQASKSLQEQLSYCLRTGNVVVARTANVKKRSN